MQQTDQIADVADFEQGLRIIAHWLRHKLDAFRADAPYGDHGSVLIQADIERGELRFLRLREEVTIKLPLSLQLPERWP